MTRARGVAFYFLLLTFHEPVVKLCRPPETGFNGLLFNKRRGLKEEGSGREEKAGRHPSLLDLPWPGYVLVLAILWKEYKLERVVLEWQPSLKPLAVFPLLAHSAVVNKVNPSSLPRPFILVVDRSSPTPREPPFYQSQFEHFISLQVHRCRSHNISSGSGIFLLARPSSHLSTSISSPFLYNPLHPFDTQIPERSAKRGSQGSSQLPLIQEKPRRRRCVASDRVALLTSGTELPEVALSRIARSPGRDLYLIHPITLHLTVRSIDTTRWRTQSPMTRTPSRRATPPRRPRPSTVRDFMMQLQQWGNC